MKVIKCDHCGKEISATVTFKNYFITKTEKHTVSVLKKVPEDCVVEKEYNTCDECYAELMAWLNDGDGDDE